MKNFLILILTALLPAAGVSAELRQSDVFASGTDGYHTFRIPSLIVTKEGALLAFAEARKESASDTGNVDLVVKRSEDGGGTWSKAAVVWDDGNNTCGNPCPVVDRDTGTIWLLMTQNLGRDKEHQIVAKTAASTRTVWVCKSEDEGKTWSPPVEITSSVKDPSWGWYATGPGVGIQLERGEHKGRLVIPCDHSYEDPNGTIRGAKAEYGSHAIYSDDHGKTWKLGGVIRPKVNECQVVELSDGRLLMDMRSYFGRSRRTHSWSKDGGLTWSAPQDHPELVEPVCQASMVRYSRRDENNLLLFSNPADPKKRLNMTVRLSRDDGKTWPVQRTINAGPSAYSCLSPLPDGTIACLYERGGKSPYERITLARFPVSWLSEKVEK